MTGTVEVCIRKPRVLAQRQDDPVVAIAHTPGAKIAFFGPFPCIIVLLVPRWRRFTLLLHSERFDPRRGQSVVGETAEDAVCGSGSGCAEPS